MFQALCQELRERHPGALALAVPLSLPARPDAALVRAIRRRLPGVPFSAELELWGSPLVEERSADVVVLRAEVLSDLRRALVPDLPGLWPIFARWLATQPPIVQQEDRLTYLGLLEHDDLRDRSYDALAQSAGAIDEEIELRLLTIARTMRDQRLRRRRLSAWIARALRRQPPRVSTSRWARILAAAASSSSPIDARLIEEAPDPEGLRLANELSATLPERPLFVRRSLHDGAELELSFERRAGWVELSIPESPPQVVVDDDRTVHVPAQGSVTVRSERDEPELTASDGRSWILAKPSERTPVVEPVPLAWASLHRLEQELLPELLGRAIHEPDQVERLARPPRRALKKAPRVRPEQQSARQRRSVFDPSAETSAGARWAAVLDAADAEELDALFERITLATPPDKGPQGTGYRLSRGGVVRYLVTTAAAFRAEEVGVPTGLLVDGGTGVTSATLAALDFDADCALLELDPPVAEDVPMGVAVRAGSSWRATRADTEPSPGMRGRVGEGGFVPTPPPLLRRGSLGGEVERWQRLLGLPVDGEFGVTTEEATRRWQMEHGLAGDGIVGSASWAAAEPALRLARTVLRGRVEAGGVFRLEPGSSPGGQVWRGAPVVVDGRIVGHVTRVVGDELRVCSSRVVSWWADQLEAQKREGIVTIARAGERVGALLEGGWIATVADEEWPPKDEVVAFFEAEPKRLRAGRVFRAGGLAWIRPSRPVPLVGHPRGSSVVEPLVEPEEAVTGKRADELVVLTDGGRRSVEVEERAGVVLESFGAAGVEAESDEGSPLFVAASVDLPMGAPVLRGERVVGLLAAEARGPERWDGKALEALEGALASAYRSRAEVKTVMGRAGFDTSRVDLEQSVRPLWWDVLRQAAQAGMLLRLCASVLKDQRVAAIHATVRQAMTGVVVRRRVVALNDPPAAPEPRVAALLGLADASPLGILGVQAGGVLRERARTTPDLQSWEVHLEPTDAAAWTVELVELAPDDAPAPVEPARRVAEPGAGLMRVLGPPGISRLRDLGDGDVAYEVTNERRLEIATPPVAGRTRTFSVRRALRLAVELFRALSRSREAAPVEVRFAVRIPGIGGVDPGDVAEDLAFRLGPAVEVVEVFADRDVVELRGPQDVASALSSTPQFAGGGARWLGRAFHGRGRFGWLEEHAGWRLTLSRQDDGRIEASVSSTEGRRVTGWVSFWPHAFEPPVRVRAIDGRAALSVDIRPLVVGAVLEHEGVELEAVWPEGEPHAAP